jgi:PAS domain S-box-containing protein
MDGIIILKPDLKIWIINPSAEILLGYQSHEVADETIDNILVGPDSFFPLLESAKNDFGIHRLGIVHIHNRNGDSIPVDARIVPVIQNNTLLAIIIYLRDVSENEEIKTRAQQLEHRAVLGEFTAVFAHEVRNPINNISMGLQILSRSFTEEPKSKDMVDRMILDCDRLTHQMEAVLAFSKPFDAKFESVDISILLQRILDRWKPRMARVGVQEFFQKSEELPLISADPRLLEQVFTNLIGNAIEAMSDLKGTLAVHIDISRTISNYPQIEVKIIDSGPGIPEEVRGHIFEPFVTTKKAGTGLGLAISKRIITVHRGNITVESYPGGGTVFAVYLPIKQGE